MTDEKRGDDDHASRVRQAFDSFLDGRAENLDAHGQGLIDRLRDAAANRDREGLREHLTEAKERHGWLYRELAAHPQLATLLDELALWGF
jgi:hypothetical protein